MTTAQGNYLPCVKKPKKRLTQGVGRNIYHITEFMLLFSLIIFSLFVNDLLSIDPEKTEPFVRRFGEEYTDDNAQALIQTRDGGFALAGITWSYGAEESDMWLVKTDSQGNCIWNRTYGGERKDSARALIQTKDNGFALVGITRSFGQGESDIWLVKVDHEGTLQWERTFGGQEEEAAYCIVESEDGGYALAGFTSSYGTGNMDMWLIKTDSEGKILWDQTFGGIEDECAFDMVQTNENDGYILAGYTTSYSAGNQDVWFLKTDSEGKILWNQTFGGKGQDQIQAIVQTSDGYALAGETRFFSDNWRDYLLIKTNFDGAIQWVRTFGGTNREEAQTLAYTKDGGYILAGFSTESNSTGYTDIWLVKTNSLGEEEWSERIGGSFHDVASAILETQNGFIIAGITDATWTVPYYGGGDVWLLKIDKYGSIEHLKHKKSNLIPFFLFLLALIPSIIRYSNQVHIIMKNICWLNQ